MDLFLFELRGDEGKNVLRHWPRVVFRADTVFAYDLVIELSGFFYSSTACNTKAVTRYEKIPLQNDFKRPFGQ